MMDEKAFFLSRPFMDVVQNSSRWHPKLTPYRFLTLLTTICLGSAKAYAVSQNLFIVATSIEWVASVVIFSMSILAPTLRTHVSYMSFTVFSFLGYPSLIPLALSNG